MENDARFYDDRIKSTTGFNQGFLVGQQDSIDGVTPLKQRDGSPLIFVPEVNLASSPENAGIRVRITSYNVCYTKLLRSNKFVGVQKKRIMVLSENLFKF